MTGKVGLTRCGTLQSKSDKNWTIAFLLSVFLGFTGADRLYLGIGMARSLEALYLRWTPSVVVH